MFNPIEQVWSLIKAYVKQELADKIVSILAMERRDGLSITEQRARALTSLIEEELGRVTPEVCNRFIAGIQSENSCSCSIRRCCVLINDLKKFFFYIIKC